MAVLDELKRARAAHLAALAKQHGVRVGDRVKTQQSTLWVEALVLTEWPPYRLMFHGRTRRNSSVSSAHVWEPGVFTVLRREKV